MKKLKILLCIVAASSLAIPGLASADDNEYDMWRNRVSIVGVWQVEFTVRVNAPDCTTAVPVPFGPNPFPSLNTYHDDGTVSETGSRSPPSARSPGHGVWERTGRKKYQARYTFQGFDANGFLATNMDIRSEIRMSADGNTFEAVARLARSDISGNVTPFCATLEGVRFEL